MVGKADLGIEELRNSGIGKEKIKARVVEKSNSGIEGFRNLGIGKEKIKARVVRGEVAPQLNTLKGPGSTGQGGLYQNSKRRYPAREVGGRVAEDLFRRGLCLPSGTAMTKEDLNRVVSVIRNCRK